MVNIGYQSFKKIAAFVLIQILLAISPPDGLNS